MRIRLLALLFVFISVPVVSQDMFWTDSQGGRAPDRDSRKSVNGVGGLLVVTSDDNWREKWDAPSETVPKFTDVHTVVVGGRLRVLTFIGNPARAADGKAQVTCDFSMQKPDGTYSVQKQDVECLSGPLLGSAKTIYLSRLVIGFVGDKDDPPGQWSVRVTIKDLVKPATIPLETRFVLQ
jgi:hypothetical protein